MPSDLEVLEWVDPDWRDHFTEVDQAADHYKRWAAEEWRKAVEECQS